MNPRPLICALATLLIAGCLTATGPPPTPHTTSPTVPHEAAGLSWHPFTVSTGKVVQVSTVLASTQWLVRSDGKTYNLSRVILNDYAGTVLCDAGKPTVATQAAAVRYGYDNHTRCDPGGAYLGPHNQVQMLPPWEASFQLQEPDLFANLDYTPVVEYRLNWTPNHGNGADFVFNVETGQGGKSSSVGREEATHFLIHTPDWPDGAVYLVRPFGPTVPGSYWLKPGPYSVWIYAAPGELVRNQGFGVAMSVYCCAPLNGSQPQGASLGDRLG